VDSSAATNSDREVTRCLLCGLVQYRPKKNNFCRKCLRFLPLRMTFRIPAAPEAVEPVHVSQATWVANIGKTISQLRESRNLTQAQLQRKSRISRSYISRIESGLMTPSISTLEKFAAALQVHLGRFFVSESDGEALLEDAFIQGLRPFLRQLDFLQWKQIMLRLRAISGHVECEQINRLAGQEEPSRRRVIKTST
jgi:transcriptional regulator with XRE-family HTH domain